MKKNGLLRVLARLLFTTLLLPETVIAQYVGIGTDTPRAPLEVHGVAGAGTTTALFGGEHGISFQRSFPSIGFNMYRDSSAAAGYYGRRMNAGYAAMISLNSFDPNGFAGFVISQYPSGAAGSLLAAGVPVFSMLGNGCIINRINVGGYTPSSLLVGRGTGIDGTAAFSGTSYTSFFNFRTTEHTYIRGGKPGSRVFINDFDTGQIIMGSGGTRVGVNAPDPQYPLEIRQVNGTGIKMINIRLGVPYSWEWRVGLSPYNLLAYYNNAALVSFSSVNGARSAVSDIRLKTNVTGIPALMDKIGLLEPVTYKMKKDDPGNTRTAGFIAQQVQVLFPELISIADSGMLGIDYSGFQVLAIKGIQEQQEKLSAIELRALELERKMKQLERSRPIVVRQFP
ncbi:MAG: tail fiber domain-containing protein [Bacteroidota bacterium]